MTEPSPHSVTPGRAVSPAGLRPRDWTDGPAKWAPAMVIGGCSVLGMAWSIAGWPTMPARGDRFEPAAASVPGAGSRGERDGSAGADGGAAVALPGVDGGTGEASSFQVNINAAAVAELELLPGIGPALAQRIIEHREQHGAFKSIDELDRVKGIGPKILERLRPLARVE